MFLVLKGLLTVNKKLKLGQEDFKNHFNSIINYKGEEMRAQRGKVTWVVSRSRLRTDAGVFPVF